jgi:hypothetical protein
VGILSLGMDLNALDDLPDAARIHGMSAAEFEAVQGALRVQRITTAAQRNTLDWSTLSSLRKKHAVVGDLVRWLNDCWDKRVPVR